MKKRKKLVLIGSGKSFYEIYPIINSIKNEYILTAIYDDDKKYYKKKIFGIPIKIGIENARKEKNSLFVFGIGSYNNRIQRSQIFKKLDIKKEFFPNIIDPTSKIAENSKLGYGNIIYPYSIICSNSKVDDFCHLTYSTIIAHNVRIGSFTLIGSRSSILNNSKLSKNVFIGASVTIGENLKIDSKSSILFGSVVIRDCEKGKTYFGNPAELIKI